MSQSIDFGEVIASSAKQIDDNYSQRAGSLRSHGTRDILNVSDIDGAKPRNLFKYDIYNKNEELLKEDVIGKRKMFKKDSNPLDPTYIMRTVSGRRMFSIGEID